MKRIFQEENRYRVTRGSKFYRIKLVPLTLPNRSSAMSSKRDRSDCKYIIIFVIKFINILNCFRSSVFLFYVNQSFGISM